MFNVLCAYKDANPLGKYDRAIAHSTIFPSTLYIIDRLMEYMLILSCVELTLKIVVAQYNGISCTCTNQEVKFKRYLEFVHEQTWNPAALAVAYTVLPLALAGPKAEPTPGSGLPTGPLALIQDFGRYSASEWTYTVR
jgi:hypothetical protein